MNLSKISLLEYIKNEQIVSDETYDCLRYELDKHVYYYGGHFKRPTENVQTDKIEKLKYNLKTLSSTLIGNFSKKKLDKTMPLIISNSYFNLNKELSEIGFNVIQPPWVRNFNDWKYYDAELISLCIKIKKLFEFSPFNYLISSDFMNLLESFSNKFKSFIIKEKVCALFIPNDESFFENISIKIFKQLSLTSFIFLHGLPSRYNVIDENRSDYLIVWGKEQKKIYTRYGFDEKKIYIAGHPSYKTIPHEKIGFSLKSILVLTKTIPGSPHSDGVILSDRGNLITYLLSIQKVLLRIGVKHVKLRPHPSESIEWYMKFLDKNFFIPDTSSINESLKQATLIIGPVSSVFLEALFFNVNYLVYEPRYNNGCSILNASIVPPFDGSDQRIPVAYDEDALLELLQKERCSDTDILPDFYQTPFDIGFIKSLIK